MGVEGQRFSGWTTRAVVAGWRKVFTVGFPYVFLIVESGSAWSTMLPSNHGTPRQFSGLDVSCEVLPFSLDQELRDRSISHRPQGPKYVTDV